MDKNISISILDAKNIPDFLRDIKRANEEIMSMLSLSRNVFSNIIHFDVMDSKFVPCNGVDLKYIKTAKNLGFYADTHLMVSSPILDKYIETAITNGTDSITIHYEIKNFDTVLEYLNKRKEELKKQEKRDLEIGVAIKPNSDVSLLEKYDGKFSKILIMSVEPGYGGQKYIKEVNEKIKYARRIFKKVNIQVDGGVNEDTLIQPYNLGVNSFVVGSYLSKAKSYNDLLNRLLILNLIKNIEDLPKDSNREFDLKSYQIVKGGYGEGDKLIGITVPNIRKCANLSYKYVNLDILNYFINSSYHEYRKYALIVLSLKSKDMYKLKDENGLEKLTKYVLKNINSINNWDLTDEVAPNVVGNYLLLLNTAKRNEVLSMFLNSNLLWQRRVGIVSLLALVRDNILELPLKICKENMYDENHLIQKACGWVLREIYKKDNMLLFNFLKEENVKNKIPSIVVTYASEKMSKTQKNIIRGK